MLPKWALDPNKHEVGRCARYMADNTLDYIGFRQPNRTGTFQEELYPQFMSNEPSNDFNTWWAGNDKPVKMMQIRPGEQVESTKKATFAAKMGKPEPTVAAVASHEASESSKEKEQAKKIAALEHELKELFEGKEKKIHELTE
jgi:hypothetical protein